VRIPRQEIHEFVIERNLWTG